MQDESDAKTPPVTVGIEVSPLILSATRLSQLHLLYVEESAGSALLQIMKHPSTVDDKGYRSAWVDVYTVIQKSAAAEKLQGKITWKLKSFTYAMMIKWWFSEAKLIALVALVLAAIVVTWKSGKQLSLDIIKFLLGAVTGFGFKAATASATKTP